ncbi:carbohydrate ABC transporter permease [Oceanispirochaeta sp.]|jgi:glucose/mannose transport system permease protein|uniref:carbohydrate ABC transporter permease n=1 Tax=Oceanispirochaeta sp. TaxID=2035350 RepID=UPI00261B3B52|nr:sugar ABC transporter permease [Oceanispirochaeta sp.]MDA3958603.1 sugar ABC transporter permease [Oceanispirochaeta sp.]
MVLNNKWRISRDDLTARFVLMPTIILTFVFVYAFIIYTVYISFTDSSLMPSFGWVGMKNYVKMFKLANWHTALKNFAIFSVLYISFATFLGLILAILVDWSKAGERFFRPIYLYPMAISFIVTGTAWKWFLDPGIGLEQIMHTWGFVNFKFDWIKNSDKAIYTVIIAAIWQVTGYVMTIFLAGLRAVNHATIESAVVDGAGTWKLYTRIIIPQLGPSFTSVFVILGHMAIKSYDLVIALTNGGPGRATEMPSTFMYSYTFTRNEMGIGASSAVFMLLLFAIIIIPYINKIVKDS